MINDPLSIDKAIEILNSVVKADAKAFAKLIEYRVPCNRELAEHPTVQVSGESDKPTVGILGILNGLFGTYEDEPKHG